MGDRRVSKRNIKGTSRFLATVRAASDCEAVPVPPVLAGPPTSGQLNFIKNLSPPSFFKLFTSNFQDIIFA